jgi:hypothetical protein
MAHTAPTNRPMGNTSYSALASTVMRSTKK